MRKMEGRLEICGNRRILRVLELQEGLTEFDRAA